MIKYLWKLAPSAMFLLIPLIAYAEDEDEKAPLSPEQLSSQRATLGVIGGLVLLGIGFYLYRRWQTIRSGNTIEGGYGEDE